MKAMQHPTPKKIQMLIRDIIRQKMEDGQLDHSQLTFGDLQKVADAFFAVLRGVLVTRIEYPAKRKRCGCEQSGEHLWALASLL